MVCENNIKRAGFIGCGNMGSALALAADADIYLSDKEQVKAEILAEKTGGKAAGIDAVVNECDFIFLGVKPQNYDELLLQTATLLGNRAVKPGLVSMAAGIRSDYVRKISACPVIRIMPNLPVMAGEGTVLYCANGASEEDVSVFLGMMSRAGVFVKTEESLIDAGSAVSGCGPAFVYMFVDALARGGEDCGLQYDTALELAVSTVRGAASMLRGADRNQPGALVKAVCSPKGSTIEGVELLRRNSFEQTLRDAVAASYRRNVELGKK